MTCMYRQCAYIDFFFYDSAVCYIENQCNIIARDFLQLIRKAFNYVGFHDNEGPLDGCVA